MLALSIVLLLIAFRSLLIPVQAAVTNLLCVGAAGLDLGAFTAFLYGFNEREVIYDIVEYMSGQRFHTSWTRVGGLNMDLPDEAVFKRMVKKFVNEQLPRAMDDVAKLLDFESAVVLDATLLEKMKGIREAYDNVTGGAASGL